MPSIEQFCACSSALSIVTIVQRANVDHRHSEVLTLIGKTLPMCGVVGADPNFCIAQS
jgi:hypothetical protein